MQANEEYMTVKQYADSKRISVQAVYKAIKTGRLKAKKVGYFTLVKEVNEEPEDMTAITIEVPADLWEYVNQINTLLHDPIDIVALLQGEVSKLLEKSIPKDVDRIYRNANMPEGKRPYGYDPQSQIDRVRWMIKDLYRCMKEGPINGEHRMRNWDRNTVEHYLPIMANMGKKEGLVVASKTETRKVVVEKVESGKRVKQYEWHECKNGKKVKRYKKKDVINTFYYFEPLMKEGLTTLPE